MKKNEAILDQIRSKMNLILAVGTGKNRSKMVQKWKILELF